MISLLRRRLVCVEAVGLRLFTNSRTGERKNAFRQIRLLRRRKRAIRRQGHSIEIGSVINLFQTINQGAPGQREASSVYIHFVAGKFHPDWQLKIQLNAVPGHPGSPHGEIASFHWRCERFPIDLKVNLPGPIWDTERKGLLHRRFRLDIDVLLPS